MSRGTPRIAYLKYDLWGKKIIIKNRLSIYIY
jgi:hypothetical protein